MRLEQWLSPCLSYNNNHQNLSQRDIVVHKMGLVQASQCFVGEASSSSPISSAEMTMHSASLVRSFLLVLCRSKRGGQLLPRSFECSRHPAGLVWMKERLIVSQRHLRSCLHVNPKSDFTKRRRAWIKRPQCSWLLRQYEQERPAEQSWRRLRLYSETRVHGPVA
jgi:hypothetical protein